MLELSTCAIVIDPVLVVTWIAVPPVIVPPTGAPLLPITTCPAVILVVFNPPVPFPYTIAFKVRFDVPVPPNVTGTVPDNAFGFRFVNPLPSPVNAVALNVPLTVWSISKYFQVVPSYPWNREFMYRIDPATFVVVTPTFNPPFTSNNC